MCSGLLGFCTAARGLFHHNWRIWCAFLTSPRISQSGNLQYRYSSIIAVGKLNFNYIGVTTIFPSSSSHFQCHDLNISILMNTIGCLDRPEAAWVQCGHSRDGKRGRGLVSVAQCQQSARGVWWQVFYYHWFNVHNVNFEVMTHDITIAMM